MDASDIIRRIQSQATWTYLKNNTLIKQPTCNYSTCSQLSGCEPIKYTTYQEKNIITLGKYYCNNTSSITTICSPS